MDHMLGRKRGQRSEANHASGKNILMIADLSSAWLWRKRQTSDLDHCHFYGNRPDYL